MPNDLRVSERLAWIPSARQLAVTCGNALPHFSGGTFRAMDAEHTLLWSSDWPHWEFDLPGRMFQLPFLSEQGRRNILGETARKVFNL
jgi:hypothetical protein